MERSRLKAGFRPLGLLALAIALGAVQCVLAQTPTPSPSPSPSATPSPSPTPTSNSTGNASVTPTPTPVPGLGPTPLTFSSVTPLVGEIGGGTTVTFVIANNASTFEIAVVYFAGVAGSKRPKEPGRLQVVTNRDPGTGGIPLQGAINYTLIGDTSGKQYTIPGLIYKFNDAPRLYSLAFTYAKNPRETFRFSSEAPRASFTAFLPVAGTVTLDASSSDATSGAVDVDGPTLLYSWRLVAGPAVDFGNGSRPAITFTPGDTPRTYTFGLTVTDSDNFTVYRVVDVAVSLQKVTALAMRLSVPDLNVTGRLFADPAFVARFKKGIADTYGVPASRIFGLDASIASVAPSTGGSTAAAGNGTTNGTSPTPTPLPAGGGGGNGTAAATPTPTPTPAAALLNATGANRTRRALASAGLAGLGARRPLGAAKSRWRAGPPPGLLASPRRAAKETASGPVAGTTTATVKLVTPDAPSYAALQTAILSVPLRSLTSKIGAATDFALGAAMDVLSATPSVFLRPANALPLALLAGGAAVSVSSALPSFVVDASPSVDPDGYITTYIWNGTVELPCGPASYYLCTAPPSLNPAWVEGSYTPLAEGSVVVPLDVSRANATSLPIAGYRPFFRYTVTLQVVDNDGMLCAAPFVQVIDIARANAPVRVTATPADPRPCLEFPVLTPVRLTGLAADPDAASVYRDGRVAGMQWRQVYGPAGVAQRPLALSSTALDLEVTAPAVGYYAMELSATDNSGATAAATAAFCVANNWVSRWARALARGFEPFVAAALPALALTRVAALFYVALSARFVASGVATTNLLGLLAHVQHVSLTGDLAAAPADYRHLTQSISWTNAQFAPPWDRGVATPDAAYRRYYVPYAAAAAAANLTAAGDAAGAAAAMRADPDMVDAAFGWDARTVFPGTVFYCTVAGLSLYLLHASFQYAVRAASRFTLPFPYPIAVPGLEVGLFLALFPALALSAAKVLGDSADAAQFALAVILVIALALAGPVAGAVAVVYALATARIAFFFSVEPPWGHHLAMRALYRAGRVRAPTNPHAAPQLPGFERSKAADIIRKEAPVIEAGAVRAVDGDLDLSPAAEAERERAAFMASLRLPNHGVPFVPEEDRAAAREFRPELTHKRRVLQIRAWYDPALDWMRRLVRVLRTMGEPFAVRGDWCATREEERRWLFALTPLVSNLVWDGSRGFFGGALCTLLGPLELAVRLAEALLVGCLGARPLEQAAALLALEAALLLYVLATYPYRSRVQFGLHVTLRAFNVAVLALLVDSVAAPRASPTYPFTLAFTVSVLHAASIVVAVAAEWTFLLLHLLAVFFGPTAEGAEGGAVMVRPAGEGALYEGAFERTGGTGIRLAGETVRAGGTVRASATATVRTAYGETAVKPWQVLPEETLRGGRPYGFFATLRAAARALVAPRAPVPPPPRHAGAPDPRAGAASPQELARAPGVGSLARPLERDALDDSDDEGGHEFALPARGPVPLAPPEPLRPPTPATWKEPAAYARPGSRADARPGSRAAGDGRPGSRAADRPASRAGSLPTVAEPAELKTPPPPPPPARAFEASAATYVMPARRPPPPQQPVAADFPLLEKPSPPPQPPQPAYFTPPAPTRPYPTSYAPLYGGPVPPPASAAPPPTAPPLFSSTPYSPGSSPARPAAPTVAPGRVRPAMRRAAPSDATPVLPTLPQGPATPQRDSPRKAAYY